MVKVKSSAVKKNIAKEPRMNQSKLDMVKQEMARSNINILGISELKCTEIGEFNSDDSCIYCCGQESLRRNGVDLIVNKRV